MPQARAELVRQAAAALGAEPSRCVVVGDIGANAGAAIAAGARAILVPTGRTLLEEDEADLGDANPGILALYPQSS